MNLHVRFKDEAQFSVRNLKNLGTCLRGLRNHYQYYVPLALNIFRAKRVSNCYMQKKKKLTVCVFPDVRLMLVLVRKIVLVLVRGTSERLVPASASLQTAGSALPPVGRATPLLW